jgi:hypothetical protein
MKQLIALLLVVTLFSCTANERARNLGGTEHITLDRSERLVNVTWKKDDLWILTKSDTTKPSKYLFKEKSSYGILEGEIIIEEQ